MQTFALESDAQFWDEYTAITTIGKGTLAKVKEVEHKQMPEALCCKVLDKMSDTSNLDDLVSEFKILRKLAHHKNVIRLYAAYETKNYFYLVTELATGGELMKRLASSEQVVYSEQEVRRHVHTLVEAISYMHQNNIAHRDLKPENVLLSDDSPDADIKIIDLGLSRAFDNEKLMRTICGTHRYLAPELIETDRGLVRGYTFAVDMWGLGMLAYIMLFGTNPFAKNSVSEIHNAILRCKVPYPQDDNVTAEAKDFIGKLLQRDPKKRMTIKEALAHKWLTADPAELSEDIHAELSVGMSFKRRKGSAAEEEEDSDELEGEETEEVTVKKSVKNRLAAWNKERFLGKAIKGAHRRLSGTSQKNLGETPEGSARQRAAAHAGDWPTVARAAAY